MALVIEDGANTLLPAAEVLNRHGKTAEAKDFTQRRVRAVPWDAEAAVQLARLLPAGSAERNSALAAVIVRFAGCVSVARGGYAHG